MNLNLVELVDKYSKSKNPKYIWKILFYEEEEENRRLSVQDLINRTIEISLELRLLPKHLKSELINEAARKLIDNLGEFEIREFTDTSSILNYIKKSVRGAVGDFVRSSKEAYKVNYDEWVFPSQRTYVSTNEDRNKFSSADRLVRCKSAEEVAIRNELYEDLGRAIDQLTDKQWNVIRGIYFQEKTQTQLAKEAGIAQPNISKRQKRAINSLKRKLKN